MVVHELVEFLVSSAFFWGKGFFIFEFTVERDEFFDASGEFGGILFKLVIAGFFGILGDIAGVGEVELFE